MGLLLSSVSSAPAYTEKPQLTAQHGIELERVRSASKKVCILIYFLERQQYGNNHTAIRDVILLGFERLHNIKFFLFFLLLVIYCVTVCVNLLIIILVYYSKTLLQSPMYIFLTQLSISDIMLTTDIVPNLLCVILHESGKVPIESCLLQLNFFIFSETSECFILTIMSYDRYLAICKPLYYKSIMNQSLYTKLVGISWLLSLFVMLISTIETTSLDFCGPNLIDHFFCDAAPLLKLSCSDTSRVEEIMMFLGIPVLFLPFIIIMFSYTYVIISIMKVPSTTGKKKAFSTCSSHLTIVCIFYISLISIYVLPTSGQSSALSKILSIFYTVGTPLINPMIYTLRNKDIKVAFDKVINHFMKRYYL
ncbi:olfactory receptor 1468-like [Rana temporaria]|uniref:olfactory receptor 1468-like n=1 Tax=Rana temporaria TaxID=8407 RepID=UPI001AAC7D59|nr:olfactory receptor 1468-like [Rana temporaria]